MINRIADPLARHTPTDGGAGPASLSLHLRKSAKAQTTARRLPPTRPQQVLELACTVTGAWYGGVALFSAEEELLEHLLWGLADEARDAVARAPWVTALARRVWRQSRTAQCFDVLLDLRPDETPLVEPPLSFVLGVPLTATGRCRGVLYLARTIGEAPFTARDEKAVLAICDWLEQGRLLEEARLLAPLQVLNQVAQAAAGNPDLSRILAVSLRELDRHTPLSISAIWLKAENTAATLVLAQHSAPPGLDAAKLGFKSGSRVAAAATPFASCLEDGQALYGDLEQPEDITPLLAPLHAGGATAWFAVPLRAGDQLVGVLQCVGTRPGGFVRDQIQLVYLVADLLGPAISNCQLFGRLRSAYEDLSHAQNQLVQAEKMRALGELAGGMAHEFNNSLCGVLGFTELALSDGALASSCRGFLDAARTCALDAAQTVRRVQDFARERRDEMAIQIIDLDELVRQTMELTRPRWENLVHARGTPITVSVQAESGAQVSGCPVELREIVTNLVFNAVDAMPGGGTLTVQTWSTEAEAFLSVRDTGVGITEAVRQRLFEPFFTTKGDRGNGLGLSVVFGIVKRHSGEIKVTSAPNEGAVFTIRLPRASEEPPPATGTEAAQPPGRSVPKRSLRILVVEDEESIRRFLSVCLTRLGHSPVAVGDAEQAKTAFVAELFDLVFTDLGLPGANGEEVARFVAERSTTPVVLLTGWADQLAAEEFLPPGVSRILGKPVTLETIETTLTAVCPV